jgi:hypothetical protein
MDVELKIIPKKILIIELIIVVFAMLVTILPFIMAYQIMIYSEIKIFIIHDQLVGWILFTFMTVIFLFLEIILLIYIFGNARIKYDLSPLSTVIAAVVGHIIFTAFAYVVIWLSLLTKIENAFYGFLVTFIIEISILSYLIVILKKQKRTSSLNF